MLDDSTLNIVREMVRKHLPEDKFKVFVFGSRASGSAAKYSDLDIGVEGSGPVPGWMIEMVRGELEESSLPYSVDVVDFSKVSDEFRQIASQSKTYI